MSLAPKFHLFICFYFIVLLSNAQYQIKGSVNDSLNQAIQSANIVITGSDNTIISYTYTDDKGKFSLVLNNYNKTFAIISANSLGFKKETDTINLRPSHSSYDIYFNLSPKAEELNTIVLKSDAKIKRDKNKIIYKVKAFENGTEQTVEDLLKKIPGIEVLDNGSIKAHGRYIDKLLIEGEDMFDKKYTILSKNLDAKVLSAIEILEGFEDNPVLAKIIESNKIAVNLKLKEDYKNVWFGNIGIGAGTKERQKLTSNIGLIRKDIKIFNFTNYNNLGNRATEQLQAETSITESNTKLKNSTHHLPYYTTENYSNSFFKNNEDVYNTAFINSLSIVKRLKPNLKLRGNAYFTNDNEKQYVADQTVFNTNDSPIIYQEAKDLSQKNTTYGSELEIKYNDSDKQYITNLTTFEYNPLTTNQNILFNNDRIVDHINTNNYLFSNQINHSILIKDKHLLHSNIHYNSKKISQDINLLSPELNTIFSQNDNAIITNIIDTKQNFLSASSYIQFNVKQLEINNELGFELLSEDNKNALLLEEEQLDSLINHQNYTNKTIYLKNTFRYKPNRKLEFYGQLNSTFIKVKSNSIKKNALILNPKIGLRIKNSKTGTYRLEYSRDYNTPFSNVLTPNFQLSNFQAFTKGSNNIQFPKRNKYTFRYMLSNNLKTQTIALHSNFITSKNRYVTSNQINQNLSYSSYTYSNRSQLLINKLDLISYFKKLNISTKLGVLHTYTKAPIAINSEMFTDFNIHRISYYLSGRTYFKTALNFNFKLNLTNNTTKLNNTSSNSKWKNINIEADYKVSEALNFSLKNNFYNLKNSNYHFLHLYGNYTPNHSKLSYQLTVNNIINETNFIIDNVDEISSYTTVTRLLPRYIFFAIKYRF